MLNSKMFFKDDKVIPGMGTIYLHWHKLMI